jgi:penicillin amidase
MRKTSRLLLAVTLSSTLVLITGGLWLYQHLQASLPPLDGQVPLAGLTAPVTVERDALGIPTIRGANRLEVARATGFVHAQDRFFQMDLLRRSAAGELAVLFGKKALPRDRSARLHRFRAQAQDVLASLPAADQQLLEAYAAGVNVGLAALGAPPFEYLLLRTSPTPWQPEDSLLVIYAMYLDLQGMQENREATLGVMHDTLPPALFEFLAPRGTEWDAPLQGKALVPPPPPGPEVFDLRSQPASVGQVPVVWNEAWSEPAAGSNNWAVSGRHTAHGGALLANDMHLRLSVPNTWYRAALVYPDEHGRERRITGITLPGMPVIVAGSNGHIAWGFTNSEGDWSDLVILEPLPNEPGAYLTPEGPRLMQHFREILQVNNGPDQVLDVAWTLWGPVIDEDYQGRQRALRWVAHDREAVNLEFLRLEGARTVTDAIAIANRTGMPAQNFLVADAEGHIGWTIIGPIPHRFGHDGRLPGSWADGKRGWDGWLAPADYPRLIDPPSGRLWTANARVLDGAGLARLGDGGYDLGARARQIRDTLLAMEHGSEADQLAVQLDDRALFLQRWRELLLAVLTPEAIAADPRRRELRAEVEQWGGRAGVESVGYRIVRTFRLTLAEQVFEPLTANCRQADPDFNYFWVRQFEGPLWQLVTQQPVHLLNPRYHNWQEQLLAAVDAVLGPLLSGGSPLAEHTWGEYNTVQIRHPFSAVIPGIGHWLDMPSLPLPGDNDMPRVQTPTHGASERLVVSPGREVNGILHMPTGQSGHPLSPHYSDGQRAWAEGKPTPFLPGPAIHRLTLLPAQTAGTP